jgi:hypothetical protein
MVVRRVVILALLLVVVIGMSAFLLVACTYLHSWHVCINAISNLYVSQRFLCRLFRFF